MNRNREELVFDILWSGLDLMSERGFCCCVVELEKVRIILIGGKLRWMENKVKRVLCKDERMRRRLKIVVIEEGV